MLEKSISIRALREKMFEKEKLTNFSFLLENISSSAKALFISYLSSLTKKDILIISGGTKEDDLIENLLYFNKNVIEFPSWETLPEENISPSLDILGERFSALKKLINQRENKILLSPLQSTLQKTISKKSLENKLIKWKLKNALSFDSIDKILSSLRYKRVSVVSDKGEYAIRGGILDIFSPAAFSPYRIEFFDNIIESIREFDSVSQKTIQKVDEAFICPAEELFFLESALPNGEKSSESLLLDYLSDEAIIIFDNLLSIEDVYVTLKKLTSFKSKYLISINDFFEKTKANPKLFFTKDSIDKLFEIQISGKEKFFQEINFDFLNEKISVKRFAHPFLEIENFLTFETLQKEEIDIFDQIKSLQEQKINTIFFTETEKEEKTIKDDLLKKNIDLKNFSFKKGYLSSSFIISDIPESYIPYSEFSHKKKIRRQKYRSTYHTPAAEFHHLTPGDLIVHYHSGIGKYLGTEKTKNHLGKEEEFLIIEYDKNSKLYVPLSQAYLVSKYIGSKDETPTLSTLGSNKWQKTKDQAQKHIVGYASDLINLYAERSERCGFAYPEDSDEMKLFEMEFDYEETPDQLKAIEEIKKDMLDNKPMERLICGDVGYGKTEVAMRAAFKAVFDGKKQVAVLVPTTVLASQHYETFVKRMEGFPITIELVSRFNTLKKNKEIIEKTKEGKVDILIGTHRLLSKDISFKNLGMIIIDEEQRFGVRAKEHLKKLKTNVDSLTLSATPIPRTLYMSLINIRDMSVINTPPQDRLPIKTIIATNEDGIIQNAIFRELAREGQLFFIHNRVESIAQRASYIQKLCPMTKILVVHGQMNSDDIDMIFHSFKSGEADILITTTIVENGIDIPNANTILIDNADTFGLADLYQLRGRVGRWNRAAYAYLLVAKNKSVSEIAKKRLNALIEAGGYGGGMKIAMRDLEIRGAGDVLGAKQSGQISQIGFHLYCKLLKRALSSLKIQKPVNFIETKMEFSFPASIPEYYIPETNLRMEIYHRLGDSYSSKELDNIKEELEDRFGHLPLETLWLISLSKIKIFASMKQINLLKFGNLTFSAIKQKGKKTEQKTMMLSKSCQSDPLFFEKKVISELEQNFPEK